MRRPTQNGDRPPPESLRRNGLDVLQLGQVLKGREAVGTDDPV